MRQPFPAALLDPVVTAVRIRNLSAQMKKSKQKKIKRGLGFLSQSPFAGSPRGDLVRN
jgi:hypothetical protein